MEAHRSLISLGQLAQHLGAALHGDPQCEIRRITTLREAGPGDVSFFVNRRYRKDLAETRASAVILGPDAVSACPVAALVLGNPYLGYARTAALFRPQRSRQRGIHGSAWVSSEAVVATSAWIGPHATVEAGARIGKDAVVGPACVISENVSVGDDTCLVASVVLCEGVRVGRRVLMHPGVVIGADGFGIANDQGVWVKVPQIGSVRIGDDVEIGANTTIDRGALEDTVIEDGVKIDNQVQIGHNVRIGAHTAIAGCVGIAGSVRIGKRCALGGAASIAGHLEIVDDVYLTASSAVSKSITAPGIYSSGMPVQDNNSWRKTIARLRHLDELARRLKVLENKNG